MVDTTGRSRDADTTGEQGCPRSTDASDCDEPGNEPAVPSVARYYLDDRGSTMRIRPGSDATLGERPALLEADLGL